MRVEYPLNTGVHIFLTIALTLRLEVWQQQPRRRLPHLSMLAARQGNAFRFKHLLVPLLCACVAFISSDCVVTFLLCANYSY
jgi:hypothetical protein